MDLRFDIWIQSTTKLAFDLKAKQENLKSAAMLTAMLIPWQHQKDGVHSIYLEDCHNSSGSQWIS